MLRKLFLLSVTLGLLAAQAAIIDNFGRADASTLGPNWTVISGGGQITGNRAAGLSNASLLTYSGLSSNTASVDIFNVGTGLQYLALVTAFQDVNNNYFVKLQNQAGDGLFHDYAFYYGNNGSGGGGYFNLSSPFSSARIIVTVSGLTANLDIDTDFDGTPDQSYSYNYATATGGTGVGLGFYGAAQADNFSTDVLPAQVPEPGTLVLTLAGLAAAGLLRKRAAR